MNNKTEKDTFLQNIHPEDLQPPAYQIPREEFNKSIAIDLLAEKTQKELQEEVCKSEEACHHLAGVLTDQLGRIRFANAVFGCEEIITVQEMAHLQYQSGADIGEMRLYQYLRRRGFVYRQACGRNMPSQRGLEMGLVELQKYVRMTGDGRKWVGSTLMVTPKGQEYLMIRLGGKTALGHWDHTDLEEFLSCETII